MKVEIIFIGVLCVGTLLTATLFIFRITRTNIKNVRTYIENAGETKEKESYLARWRKFLDAKRD